MKATIRTAIPCIAAMGVLALASCGGDESTTSGPAPTEGSSSLPQGSEPADLDPAEFTTEIDNPWWPMSAGSRWVYRETDTEGGEQRVVVEVTGETKTVANGVEAVVVRDTVTENGQPVEVTDDWYAQDADGNIWYLGEDTAEYEDGEITTRAGSFEAGVDGAEAGIIMPADPQPGMEYRQEYYEGEAEDEAAVVTVGEEQVAVPAGYYDDIVMTRDLVPLEPKVEELKFFARGVGPVLVAGVSESLGIEQLISYERG